MTREEMKQYILNEIEYKRKLREAEQIVIQEIRKSYPPPRPVISTLTATAVKKS